MLRIKFDQKLIKFISMFESMTQAEVKDCIELENMLIFIVAENQIGKAIGKEGSNVRRLENLLKKKVRIIEYNKDIIKFVENIIYPNKAKEIRQEEKRIMIVPSDSKSRGFLIGRNATILRSNENIVKRYFEIDEIKIVQG